MTIEDEIIPLLPADLPLNLQPDFIAGTKVGLINIRPACNPADEDTILDQLRQALNGAASVRTGGPEQAFCRGIQFGIKLRVSAERNAVEMNRFLAGDLPVRPLRLLAVRKRRARELIRHLEPFERKLLNAAFAGRYLVELSSVIPLVFFKREARKLIAALNGDDSVPHIEVPAQFAGSSPADADKRIKHRTPSADTPPADSALQAAQLYQSIYYCKSSWPGRLFLGTTSSERDVLIAEYEKRYGQLRPQIRSNYRGWEQEFLLDLIDDGAISPGKLFYLCVIGFGTDEHGLHLLLSEMTPDEVAGASAEFGQVWRSRAPWYERPFPRMLGNLERRIWIETGGDTFFDLQKYFSSPVLVLYSAQTERLEQLYSHERSGLLLRKIKVFLNEGTLLDRDVAAVRNFIGRFAGQLEQDRALTIRLDALVQYAELDCQIFRSLKHIIGNRFSAAVSGATAAGATVALTLLHVKIGIVMAVVASVSLASRFGLKRLLKGRGYHFDEIGADLFFGLLDGVTLYTAAIFRQAMVRYGTRFVTTLTIKSGVSRFSSLIGGSRTGGWGVRIDELCRDRGGD